jgi:putative transposase
MIARECWYELPYRYAGLELDAFVVMPNHVHGIVVLRNFVGAGLKPARSATPRPTLTEVVRAFKTFSGRKINELANTTGTSVWQRGYYEHIVRSEKSLREIRQYITDNPRNWAAGPENPAAVESQKGGFETRPYKRGS